MMTTEQKEACDAYVLACLSFHSALWEVADPKVLAQVANSFIAVAELYQTQLQAEKFDGE